MIDSDDVIVDVLQRVSESADVPDATLKQVERDARHYWGGARPYIRQAGESPRRAQASDRASRIRAEHRDGERIPLLARRHGISERHVRRILGIAEHLQTPPANDPAPEAQSGTMPAGGVVRRRRRRG